MMKILVPVDFSETSLLATREASALAQSAGADLVLLHADEFPVSLVGSPDYLAAIPSHLIEAHERDVRERLLQLQHDMAKTAVRVSSKVVVGPAHQVIADVAAAEHVDLIVMGTHGLRGFRRLFAGSVTERVVRIATVPVLAVRLPAPPKENAPA